MINSAIEELKRVVSINNKNAEVLYISINDSGFTINGDEVQYHVNFTQEQKTAIVSELVKMGATLNTFRKNSISFSNPSLLFGGSQKDAEVSGNKVVNGDFTKKAIEELRRLASINNKNSGPLYIKINDSGFTVNGDEVEYRVKFTEDQKRAIMFELINMGATLNPHVKDSIHFETLTLLLGEESKEIENSVSIK